MRRLVFAAPVTRATLLEFFAMRNVTCTSDIESEDTNDDALAIRWSQNEEMRTVTFRDDIGTQLQYLTIESESSDQEVSIESDIRHGPFQFWSIESVLGDFDAAITPENTIHTFAKLVTAAPEAQDPLFLRRIERALGHPAPEVRAECLELLSRVSWPELLVLITPLKRDPNGTVRHAATVASNEFRALGLG